MQKNIASNLSITLTNCFHWPCMRLRCEPRDESPCPSWWRCVFPAAGCKTVPSVQSPPACPAAQASSSWPARKTERRWQTQKQKNTKLPVEDEVWCLSPFRLHQNKVYSSSASVHVGVLCLWVATGKIMLCCVTSPSCITIHPPWKKIVTALPQRRPTMPQASFSTSTLKEPSSPLHISWGLRERESNARRW